MKKFAIIGLGFISDRHIKTIDDIGGKIVCACDIIEAKRLKIMGDCREVNEVQNYILKETSPSFFVDWNKMMKSDRFEEVDYVVILTPNDLHLPMIYEARKREKKVICEKPLVLSLDQ
jgi:predicted dehydrogenase